MEASDIKLLEELAVVRQLFSEAAASTQDLAHKLSLSLDESDGWPVLLLKTVSIDSESKSNSLKIYGNDRGQVLLRSSLHGDVESIALSSMESQQQLKELVLLRISELLGSTVSAEASKDGSGEDSLFSEDPQDGSELFDSVDEASDEDIEALPDLGL